MSGVRLHVSRLYDGTATFARIPDCVLPKKWIRSLYEYGSLAQRDYQYVNMRVGEGKRRSVSAEHCRTFSPPLLVLESSRK